MLSWSAFQLDFKIAPDSGEAIIGSNSVNSAGDLYQIPINSIGEAHNRRMKRLNDLFIGICLLIFSPLLIWIFLPRPFCFIRNTILVIIGARTWVSFKQSDPAKTLHLPKVKKGILTPLGQGKGLELSDDEWLHANLAYARDYSIQKDLRIIMNYFRFLNQ